MMVTSADSELLERSRLPQLVRLYPAQMECIDGLRAVAVLLVIIQHFKVIFLGPHGILSFITTPGASGVMLFFVISGLCISLSKTERLPWSAFYLRRLFRLLPALYVSMALVFGMNHFLLHKPVLPLDILGTLLVLPHQLGSLISINPPLWSLQTEIELYFLFPISLYIFNILPKPVFIAMSILVTFVAYFIWFAVTNQFTYFPPFFVLCHIAVWNAGLLLAFDTTPEGKTSPILLGKASAILLLSALLLLAHNYFHSNAFAFWYIIAGYGFYLLVKWAIIHQPKILRLKGLRLIGLRSYSLYLLHLPIAIVCIQIIHSRWLAFSVTLIVVFGLTELIYRFVEIPFITFGKTLTTKGFIHNMRA